jgi:SAM-dependent methyltransferase
MTGEREDPFPSFLAALRARHVSRAALSDLRKGIVSLSTLYLERREKLTREAPFEGEGKRAAFALYYAPLHFIAVRRIVRELGAASPPPRRILDLGCGTGAGGAAWAIEAGGAEVEGVEASPWAVEEARWALETLGVPGKIRRGDAARARFPGKDAGILAAYFVNELGPEDRRRLLSGLLRAAEAGARVLIVEPIARPLTPWWDSWSAEFSGRGGRSDDWRFVEELPEEIEELDGLSGLDHRELTARSLWLDGSHRQE